MDDNEGFSENFGIGHSKDELVIEVDLGLKGDLGDIKNSLNVLLKVFEGFQNLR